ncbi:MAG: response regulator transcription factor [Spirochaetaceae bacterium]|nr:response regulator transcription factor [Spirochaetaceae bacterium]
MLTVGLCDDEEPELEKLHGFLEAYGREGSVPLDIKRFASGEDLLLSIGKGGTFDIVFLDVYMGLTNGVDVAREIREHDEACCIIFATNSRGHAIDGYGVHALRYLLKPIAASAVAAAMDQAVDCLARKSGRFVLLQNRQGSYKIRFDEVVFVESDARVVIVHSSRQGDLRFYCRLDDFAKRCDDPRFLRCHKSYIVNLDYVHAIANHSVVLEDGREIRISMKLSEAKDAFASYMTRNI